MTSILLKTQFQFSRMVPRLIDKAHELGYGVSLGDCYRDRRCKYGSDQSKHRMRLAIDLNLFKDGRYIKDDEGHRELGEWWESQGGTWGGRWENKDFNHYQYDMPKQV